MKRHEIAAYILGGILAIAAPFGAWYKAKVQADVYRRQGVEMTTWEVMLGAKPIERSINIKESP
jgi:hypothetical protein